MHIKRMRTIGDVGYKRIDFYGGREVDVPDIIPNALEVRTLLIMPGYTGHMIVDGFICILQDICGLRIAV